MAEYLPPNARRGGIRSRRITIRRKAKRTFGLEIDCIAVRSSTTASDAGGENGHPAGERTSTPEFPDPVRHRIHFADHIVPLVSSACRFGRRPMTAWRLPGAQQRNALLHYCSLSDRRWKGRHRLLSPATRADLGAKLRFETPTLPGSVLCRRPLFGGSVRMNWTISSILVPGVNTSATPSSFNRGMSSSG